MSSFIKNYASSLLLFAGLVAGALVGAFAPSAAHFLRPVGEIFLNLIFVMVVPLVFFSTASAICRLRGSGSLGGLFWTTFGVFLVMSLVAAGLGMLGTSLFSIAPGEGFSLQGVSGAGSAGSSGAGFDASSAAGASGAGALVGSSGALGTGAAIVGALTASDFSLLLSKEHMLALLIFAALFGFAAAAAGEKGLPVRQLLESGNEVMVRMVGLVMKAAPLGLGCYIAGLIPTLGTLVLGGYLRVLLLYCALTLVLFFIINSLYVLGSGASLGKFWRHIWEPAATAAATASSAAAIPSAIAATKRMGVRDSVAEVVIPLGTNLHRDGSVLGAIFKIAFLMLLTGRIASGPEALPTILGVALLESVVLSAVPSGGLTGEIFICSVMGFDPSLVTVIVVIGVLIDIPATLLNAGGNVTAAVVIDRLTARKRAQC